MKIAIVTEYYYPDVGGTPEHVYHLGLELMRRGHEVRVVTPEFGPEDPSDPCLVPVRRTGRSVRFMANGSLSCAAVGFHLGRELRDYLADERFDVVHVHSPLFPTLPLLAVKHAPPRAAVVGTLHTHFAPRRIFRLLRSLCQRYMDALDGVIAVSDTAARSVRRYAEFDYDVIPNGVDVKMWSDAEPLPALRDGKVNVAWLSRIEPRNRLGRLLRAFVAVNRRLGNIARLLVLGDGPARREHERDVPPDQRESVQFVGRVVSERPRYLRSSDIFCFPTDLVASPVTLLEGLAAGCATIACDIDGVRQIVRHEREGLLVPPTGDEPLAAALEALIINPLRRLKFGNEGRRRAAEYAWAGVARRIEGVYLASGARD